MNIRHKLLLDSSKVPQHKATKYIREKISNIKSEFLLKNIASMYALTYDQVTIFSENIPEHELLLEDCIKSVTNNKEKFLKFEGEVIFYDNDKVDSTPIEIITDNSSVLSLILKTLENSDVITTSSLDWSNIKSKEDDYSNMLSSIDLQKLPEVELDTTCIQHYIPSPEERIDLFAKNLSFQVFKQSLLQEGILDSLEHEEIISEFKKFLYTENGKKVFEESKTSIKQKINLDLEDNFKSCPAIKA